MKTLWIGVAVSLASPLALAQSTIYKHVDESGRVTYSNRPMQGAIVLDLEPLSTIPGFAGAQRTPATTVDRAMESVVAKPAVAVVTPRPATTRLAAIDREPPQPKAGGDSRRKSLEEELAQQERGLSQARKSLLEEQRNPALVAAVRIAQQATDPTPEEQAQMRASIDRASGRIRGLQATVAEHEKNIEALGKELGELKP